MLGASPDDSSDYASAHPSSGELRYRLLGPVTARGESGPIRLGGPKQRTVLAALLLNANRVVSEEHLTGLLWEDNPPASARGQLQVRVWELRKLLGRSVIVRSEPGYLIEVRPGELDTRIFEDSVAGARALLDNGDTARGVAGLRAALDLWQGSPLGGVTDALVRRAAQMLEEQRMAALEALFDAELAAGRHAVVIGELRGLCEQYPFGERLQAQLMVALHRSGRASEALEVYSETRERLGAELGVKPGKALRELHLQVLQGSDRPGGGTPAPVVAAMPDIAPARSVTTRPAQTAGTAVRPAELPRDVRGFAGRAEKLALLDAQLAATIEAGSPMSDVWVVNGIAGVGKTALALHWAHGVREQFPDGQLYVNLRGFDADREPMEPAVALGQLLRALGADPRGIPTEVDEQAGLYRSTLADKRVLLVLDNARDANQVLPLLPPTGTVLVTSRNRLGDLVAETGARSLPLGVLPLEESRALLIGVLGVTRVDAESEAVDELGRLCGHLPLALRIAAANVSTSLEPRVADMAAELAKGDPLAALTVDGAEESAVTRAFAVSYETLAPELRRLFRLLGLIAGPDFTPVSAAAVAGDPIGDVTRRLQRLAAAHLVEQHVAGRFRFHDLVRDYAVQCAGIDENAEDRARAWRRLVELHLSAADSAEDIFGRRHNPRIPRDPAVTPGKPVKFADSAAAAAWVDAEHENMMAVVRQAVAHGPFPQAWYLADAVRGPFYHRGRRVEWVDIASTVLAAARRHDQPLVEAVVLHSVGLAFIHLKRHEQAVEWLTEALRVFRRTNWPEGEAAALNAFGIALRVAGRFEEAGEQLMRSLELERARGSRIGEMKVLNNLGSVYRQLCRLDEASDCLNRAYEISVEEGFRLGEAVALVGLGLIRRLTGERAAARDSFARALVLHHELSYLYGEASALSGLSLLDVDEGEFASGRERATRALELARREQNRETEVGALNALARAEVALNLLEPAAEHQREAVEVARKWGSTWHVAEALCGMAGIHAARCENHEALRTGEESLILARNGGLRTIEARCLLVLAGVHAWLGRPGEAKDLCAQAVSLSAEAGLVATEARAREILSRFAVVRAG
jgi:DNA-binding SARP family transcriptional activator/tetratricopeptide (TPR) repeat protein